jgi:hypothetical protein
MDGCKYSALRVIDFRAVIVLQISKYQKFFILLVKADLASVLDTYVPLLYLYPGEMHWPR